MTLGGQLPARLRGRLGRPPQRRHRVAPLVRLDQRQQRGRSPGSSPRRLACGPRRAGEPGRPQRLIAGIQLEHPGRTVASRTPAARATARTPPWPSGRASSPITSRCCRSFRCGNSTLNRKTSCPRTSTDMPIPAQQTGKKKQQVESLRLLCSWHLWMTRLVEDVFDRAGEGLRPVQDGQDGLGDVQAALAQPGDQVRDQGGVLGRALLHRQRVIDAVDADAQRNERRCARRSGPRRP